MNKISQLVTEFLVDTGIPQADQCPDYRMEIAYRMGYEDAIKNYAIWKDLQRPMKTVLAAFKNEEIPFDLDSNMKYELIGMRPITVEVPGEQVTDRIRIPMLIYKRCWLDRLFNRWIKIVRSCPGYRQEVFYWPARKLDPPERPVPSINEDQPPATTVAGRFK